MEDAQLYKQDNTTLSLRLAYTYFSLYASRPARLVIRNC